MRAQDFWYKILSKCNFSYEHYYYITWMHLQMICLWIQNLDRWKPTQDQPRMAKGTPAACTIRVEWICNIFWISTTMVFLFFPNLELLIHQNKSNYEKNKMLVTESRNNAHINHKLLNLIKRGIGFRNLLVVDVYLQNWTWLDSIMMNML